MTDRAFPPASGIEHRTPMPIPFACPHCGRQTLVEDKFAGQSGACVACGKPINVPLALTSGAVVPSERKEISTGATAAIAIGCGLVLVLIGVWVFCAGGLFIFF
jgi:hypothetical protein